jgi:hypothetical protein
MSAAALTPRVRIIAVCNEVAASETEGRVFNLEGVRQHLSAGAFPAPARLMLFLLLSSARAGEFEGKILVVHDRTDRTIRYGKFTASFPEDNDLLPLSVDIGECLFPEPGRCTFQVWFLSRSGHEAQKGEQPFDVLAIEE